jgi:site-specific recombinase XerC
VKTRPRVRLLVGRASHGKRWLSNNSLKPRSGPGGTSQAIERDEPCTERCTGGQGAETRLTRLSRSFYRHQQHTSPQNLDALAWHRGQPCQRTLSTSKSLAAMGHADGLPEPVPWIDAPPWLKRRTQEIEMTAPLEPRRQGPALPPQHAHAPRTSSSAAHDPDAILRSLPEGTRDYLRVLGAILRKHNHQHSAKHKNVSLQTMVERQRFLAGFFHELRHQTRFNNLDPRQLATRHIETMVARWVDRGLATATIHNRLSFLRTYAGWIGKPGLVLPPERYVGIDSVHVHRVRVATEDASWSAKSVDIPSKIAEVAAFDPWVGLQLELCHQFGLRAKEARHFRPHGAVVQREAASARDTAPFPEVEQFVHVAHGTKGGRPRFLPLVNDAQRNLLERCRAVVAPGLYVGWPHLTMQRARRRFYYVVQKFGITNANLGVTPHGLRHQHVNDAFERDARTPSPVRGGHGRTAQDEAARTRASTVLGHGRNQVSSCYLGSNTRPRAGKPMAAAASVSCEVQIDSDRAWPP